MRKAAGRTALLALLTLPVVALQSASMLNGFAFRAVMVITPLEVEDFLAALGTTPEGAAPTVALLITVATVAGIPGTLSLASPASKRAHPCRELEN